MVFSVAFFFVLTACPSMAQQAAGDEKTAQTTEEVLADTIVKEGIEVGSRQAQNGLSIAVLDADIDPDELEFRLVPLTKSELEKLASEWLAIVKSKTEEVMAAQIAIAKTKDGIEDAVRQKLVDLTQKRRALFDKYAKVLSAWEKKGADPAAVAEYRAYQSAIIVEETRSADFKTLLAQAKAWLLNRDGGIRILINVLIILVAMLALFFSARIIRRVVGSWINRVPNLSKLLQAFLVTTIYWLFLAVGLMVVLSALGIDVTPVFALIGGASFVMAFAFQDTLGNLASGLMIMANRPFDQGDFVDVGGVSGTVENVSIVATKVLTPDNQVIVIPNKNVWGNIITNVTASKTRRVDLVFGISYEDSIPDAAKVIEDVVKAHPLVLDDPAPVIRVHELADSSVNFICRPWTKTVDYWSVYWDLTQQVKERFDAAGISIPYPQQDVHFYSTSGEISRQLVNRPSSAGPSVKREQSPPARKTSKSKAIAKGEVD